MSSIVFNFSNRQDVNLLKEAVRFAIEEECSSFVLDNGSKVSFDWFNINSIDVSMYEKAMDPDDVETAHSRLCDILINMNPEIAFSSYATYLNRITGYEKVFHIDYKNGNKSGFDVEADGSPCCPDCDEPLIDITEYEPGQTYQCECGYEYDPVEEFDWFVESYDSLAVDYISELKK